MRNMEDPLPDNSFRSGVNYGYILVCVHSLCVLPFLRCGFGAEGLGLRAALVIPFVFAISAIKQAPEAVWLLPIWFAAVLIQRAIYFRKKLQGERIHSYYQGDMWFALRVLRIRSELVARFVIEPLICVLVGLALTVWSTVGGGIVATAAISLVLKATIDKHIADARVRRMRDAYIEQTYYAERFREGD